MLNQSISQQFKTSERDKRFFLRKFHKNSIRNHTQFPIIYDFNYFKSHNKKTTKLLVSKE